MQTPDQSKRQAEHAIQLRILSNGNPVTNDFNGLSHDLIGDSYSDTLNIIGTALRNANNPRQVDLYTGGGASFLYDYLVDASWAAQVTAGLGAEGQQFTNPTGSTYKVYSDLPACIAQAHIDFPSASPVPTIFIKAGTYTANVTNVASPGLRIIGQGASRVFLGNATSASPYLPLGSQAWISGVSLQANSAAPGIQTSRDLWMEDCIIVGGTSSSAYGVSVTGAGAALLHMSQCDLSGLYAVRNITPASISDITKNRFTSCTVGISLGANSNVTDNAFTSCRVPIQLENNADEVLIDHNNFYSTLTACIKTLSGGAGDIAIRNNFTDGTPIFLDCSSLVDSSLNLRSGWVIADNNGNLNTGGVVIAFPATAKQASWEIHDNSFTADGAASFSSGAYGWPGMKAYNNAVRTTTTASNDLALEPVHPGITRSLTGDIYWVDDDVPMVIGVAACTIRFGDTDVAVARQLLTLPIDAINYLEINSAGTFQQNPTAFSAGTYHVLKVVTGHSGIYSTYVSHVDVGGMLYVGAAASGAGGPASNADSFVVISDDPDLTAERTLTAGNGVGFTDGGATGLVTLNLKDLTGAWTQAGVFPISHAGNLTVLKHASFGAGAAVDPNLIVNVKEQFNDPAASPVAVGGQLVTNLSALNSLGATAMGFTNVLQGGFEQTGIMTGALGSFLITGAGTIADDIRSFDAEATIITGRVKKRTGFYVGDAANAGVLDTQYGVYSEALVGATTNWFIYSLGGKSSHLDSFSIGSNSTPSASAILDLTNAANLALLTPAIVTASRPAGVNGLIYYDSTTNKFVAYQNGAYINMISAGSSPLTTKGDLWGFSTVDARIPIGTNGQALVADSAQTLGLKWAKLLSANLDATGNKQGLYFTGAAALLPTTNPSGAVTTTETATNKVNYRGPSFAAQPGADKYCTWAQIQLPANYDAGTFTAQFDFIPVASDASAAHTVIWGVELLILPTGTTVDTAWGTRVTVSTTLAANQAGNQLISAVSGAVTAGGTPAAGSVLYIRVSRINTDTNTGAMILQGVSVKYTTTASISV